MRSLLAPLMVTLALTVLCYCEKEEVEKKSIQSEEVNFAVVDNEGVEAREQRGGGCPIPANIQDPKDPSGSPSAASIKIKKEVANAFVKRQKRSSIYERYMEYYKSPVEQMHERCENYPPCDYLSDQIGFSTAYNYYFGRY